MHILKCNKSNYKN